MRGEHGEMLAFVINVDIRSSFLFFFFLPDGKFILEVSGLLQLPPTPHPHSGFTSVPETLT